MTVSRPAGSPHPGPGTRLRDWQLWSLAEPLRSYIAGVALLAMAAIVLAVARAPWHLGQFCVFLGLLASCVITVESTRMVREIHGAIVRDMLPVFYLAIAVTLPPAYAFAAPVPLLAHKLWRIPWLVMYRKVFSYAALSLAYGSVSVAFHALPGLPADPPGGGARALAWAGAVAGFGLLAWAIGDALLIIAIRLTDPAARMRELTGGLESVLIELSLGISLAVLVAIDPVLMVLALPPAVLFRRYLMRAQLVALVRIDANTGLLNEMTWQREAGVEASRAARTRAPVAVAVISIDDFAATQTAAGDAGSEQLRHGIAGLLREQLRDDDLIGRHGGKEFAVLLPRTGREEARRISGQLRDRLSAASITIESGAQAGFVLRPTVSIGVAAVSDVWRPLGELTGAAEAALGQARRSGRNMVHVLPDSWAAPEESPRRARARLDVPGPSAAAGPGGLERACSGRVGLRQLAGQQSAAAEPGTWCRTQRRRGRGVGGSGRPAWPGRSRRRHALVTGRCLLFSQRSGRVSGIHPRPRPVPTSRAAGTVLADSARSGSPPPADK